MLNWIRKKLGIHKQIHIDTIIRITLPEMEYLVSMCSDCGHRLNWEKTDYCTFAITRPEQECPHYIKYDKRCEKR